MKMTILQAIQMTQPDAGIHKLNQQDLPVQTAYKVLQISQAIDRALEHYNTIRRKLADAYAEPLENGQQQYTFSSQEDKEEFETRMTNLLEYEITIDQEPLTDSDLQGHEVTARDLALLMPIMDKDRPQPSETLLEEMNAAAGIA